MGLGLRHSLRDCARTSCCAFPFRSPRGTSKSFNKKDGFLLEVGFLPAALCLRHSVHFLFISSLEQARLGWKMGLRLRHSLSARRGALPKIQKMRDSFVAVLFCPSCPLCKRVCNGPVGCKKGIAFAMPSSFDFWVEDGIRTHDP